ncbi:microcin ABC transporter ATP-binding protein [Haematobacter missouriensis]|uniref:ABC transporter ATP-binding protein n=1 Tax=Haematobacter missouriensis TaxID=366616 RepID=A0A212AU98_9RHOB|nr:ABC transporter ATP-binding protein [Haematobacter missouriensis]KFI33378.1 microcin ABC transporter ATP-binding protein [Haematobacter missouriensis]OWJ77205.1 ABC transporter ATP-binding protein [Haematobacter missouriensis]OWJ85062.1 ABC transporter ATP-binding protein [Haematobacter missouriensis]
MSLLEVEDLAVAVGGRTVLAGVSLTLAPGERLALVGPSGSGKSMLAAAIAGLLPARAAQMGGTIRFGGQTLAAPPDWQPLRGRRIGMVFQEPRGSLNPLLSIRDQVADVVARHQPLRPKEVAVRVAGLLEDVRFPPGLADALPHELSGGLCQRAAVAAALAGDPALFIADEATTDLDTPTQAGILDLIDEAARARGMAVMLITHDIAVAAGRSDRVAALEAGRIVETGTTRAMLTTPHSALMRGLVAAARPRVAPAPPAIGGEVLRAEGLARRFRLARGGWGGTHIAAVEGADLALRAGEAVGLIGPSGSGKTTLARMICRLEQPDGGRLHLMGEDALAVPLRRFAHHPLRVAVQLALQDAQGALPPRWTARRAIDDPLRLLRPALGEAEREGRLQEAVRLAGLPEVLLDRPSHTLSGGERARVGLARALAPEPAILVLDEPTSALDATLRGELLERLDALRRQRALALLFISHDLSAVARLCDRALVMEAGRVVEVGPVARLLSHPQADCTRALVAAMPILASEQVAAGAQNSPCSENREIGPL